MYKKGDIGDPKSKKKLFVGLVVVGVLLIASVTAYFLLFSEPTVEQKAKIYLSYSDNVDQSEQDLINQKITEQNLQLNSEATLSTFMDTELQNSNQIMDIYVPVTNFNSVIQKITIDELKTNGFKLDNKINQTAKNSITTLVGVNAENISNIDLTSDEIAKNEVVFIPIASLDSTYKLLFLDDEYYLDKFKTGAIFRTFNIEGEGAVDLATLKIKENIGSESIYKVNMSGVTALTRIMMRKLNTVKDPLYFSEKIGDFLADADLTHVSNEVSFKEGCTYSDTLFCSPPEFIETLKASGVDLVELTGNHNNDLGAQFNTNTINLYKELGWETVGGGLNVEEAAKSVIKDEKGSKIAFLAYNYPDSPNGGAIAGANKAGANSFDFDKIASDIELTKQSADFTIVNIQYWECYAYPNGYVEYPICDKPIGEQEADFKKIAELGADMVIGSSAHQPQTYEIYDGVPIYYGLGNMYFDQTSWPGTERGIILTHYFNEGKLLQTKLTPTVYDRDLQTRIMTDEEAEYLLTRLHDAR